MIVTEQLKDMARNKEDEGALKQKERIALSMFRQGADPSFICEVTGLEMSWVLMLGAKIS